MATLTQRLISKVETFVGDTRRRHEPLYRKLKEHYKDNDISTNPNLVRRSRYLAAFLMWFTASSALYTGLKYTVPYYVGQVWGYDWWIVYWCKVVMAFGFIQITANWTCIRCYTSYFAETEDRPNLRKTLWDKHPERRPGVRVSSAKMAATEEGRTQVGRWQHCKVCQIDRPPRAHHCKVCQRCTLKRDHHCFIIGSCIGFYNQRYFVVMTFYIMMYCVICLFLSHIYLRDMIYASYTVWDYFLPYTLLRSFTTDTVELHHFLLLCQVYTFVWLGPMCASFFALQLCAIALGKTMHEFTRNHAIRVHSGVGQNFRSVFGSFWLLNFFFPAVILFRQDGDGTEWPDVRVGVRRSAAPNQLLEVKTRTH